MKNLYLIGGAMGVGKTTVCEKLKKELPDCVFLDGDWCWNADPFQITPETRAMVLVNICCLLNNFIHCSAYKNILFCWVMHEQSIIDEILRRLDSGDCRVRCISLICNDAELKDRLEGDIKAGIRSGDIVKRSLERIPLYFALDTMKIDTTGKTVLEISQEIRRL